MSNPSPAPGSYGPGLGPEALEAQASDRGQARLRVLLSAYVCRPGRGSEPGLGWEFLRAAAKSHEIVLMTQKRDVSAIAEALEGERTHQVTFVPIATPAWLRRFEGQLGLGHLDYLVWQWRAWKAARGLSGEIHVAHHLTFANDWLPCAVLFLRDVPVVWGPVGGTARFPWALMRYLSAQGLAREVVRELVTRALRIYTASLVRRSHAVVIGANGEVAARFEAHAKRVFVEPHVAMAPAPAPAATVIDGGGAESQRRAIFAARLSSWKGPYLALEAMARMPPNWRLDMYGTGEDETSIRRRADRLGLGERVRMLGHRPLEELRAALAKSDALIFPSMHDAAPYTVAEAVRLGCPVVCLEIGGPPLLVADGGGIGVPPDARAPDRMADALKRVRRRPPSDRWNGDRLVDAIAQWYDAALGVSESADHAG
ncbi:MAG: glycosyltransferase [Solirubrobacteraceae bacterium]